MAKIVLFLVIAALTGCKKSMYSEVDTGAALDSTIVPTSGANGGPSSGANGGPAMEVPDRLPDTLARADSARLDSARHHR
jgi:hypothetical protein